MGDVSEHDYFYAADGRTVKARDRRVSCREGRLYENGQALKIRTSSVGVLVGCTTVEWEAFDAIVKRVALLGGRS